MAQAPTMCEDSAENLSFNKIRNSLHCGPIISRMEDGLSIYRGIISILRQRAISEENYGKDLQKLSHDWLKLIAESKEYGSTREALLSIAVESIKVGEAHSKIGTCVLPELIATVERLMINQETFSTEQGSVDRTKFTESQFQVNFDKWIDAIKNEQNELEKFTKIRDQYGNASAKSKDAHEMYSVAVEKRKNGKKMYKAIDHFLLKKCHEQELVRKGCLKFLAMDLHKSLYPIECDENLEEYHDLMNKVLVKADAEEDVSVWNKNNHYAFVNDKVCQ